MFMTEKPQGPGIEIAGKHASISDIRRRAEQPPQITATQPEIVVNVDTGPVADQMRIIAEGQKDIIESFENHRITLDQLLGVSQRQTRDLIENLRKVDPTEERERWVDVEYKQQFYTRFTPNLEPRFYTELKTVEERALWDARWQLARAAFVKMATSAFPDKYRENQDLSLLGKEQMERLYRMPGTKKMLEAFAQSIFNGKKVTFSDGREVGFWDVQDQDSFDQFRRLLRDEALDDSDFSGIDEVRQIKGKGREEERKRRIDLMKKEADVVAWNLMWVSNLTESSDSRYSRSQVGYSHMMPTSLVAGEYKYVLHPQERFEGKCMSGHFYGAFGEWGATQIEKVTEKIGFNRADDEIWFTAATRQLDYWTGKELSDKEIKAGGGRRSPNKKGKVFLVSVPECYPTVSAKSFWEFVELRNEKGKKRSLLDFLMKGDEIPWSGGGGYTEGVGQDAWPAYINGNFHKAYQIMEYFNGEKPLEERKEVEWTRPILELFVRLKFNDGSMPIKPSEDFASALTFHNLKVWAVFASRGGVRNPRARMVSNPLDFMDRKVMENRLAKHRMRYLDNKEKLQIEDPRK